MSTGAPDQSVLSHVDRIEAKLDAVRALHRPVPVAISGSVTYGPSGLSSRTIFGLKCWCCGGDGMVIRWPCPTAKLAYSPDEISKIKEAT